MQQSHQIHRTSLPNMPLIGYKQPSIFKLYLCDIGLLSARANLSPETYISDDNTTFSQYKGGLTEQYVLQQLIATNDKIPIYYWATDKNTAEIEFVAQIDGQIIPIEVKAGKNTRSESVETYKKEFQPSKVIRTSLKKYGVNDGMYSIPLYAIEDVLR